MSLAERTAQAYKLARALQRRRRRQYSLYGKEVQRRQRPNGTGSTTACVRRKRLFYTGGTVIGLAGFGKYDGKQGWFGIRNRLSNWHKAVHAVPLCCQGRSEVAIGLCAAGTGSSTWNSRIKSGELAFDG